ncbi:bifunctional DNA-formamidopyrimidine glycosylase/DNA-(apurinic or apyrimidinic site) lyase [Aquabacterium sp.]|uniref:bifunctional DNA-formamidopyrimidine glycosylase/DNA-(apurinic or apyrimidinic site) lyase n=1 Tax=Aquabacterium sp. TaxID=1872578 RepID=UPI0035B18205
MPELPEVEVTRQSFADRIVSAEVVDVVLGKPLRWPLGVDGDELRGCRVGAVIRRGKYLWVPLIAASGHRSGGLLIHLGMSGSLSFEGRAGAPGKHDHFDLVTTRGTLRLHDPRRFGAVVWGASMHEGMPGKLLSDLGREPFGDPELTPEWMRKQFKGRSVSIKQALLAGDVVVGAGNIYACEALFRAGIDPRLAAGRVSGPRCERLLREVRAVLSEAVALGGSSLKDFKDAQGNQGHFQLSTQVYGREGEPCRVCGSLIRRIVQGQRATYYCPICQKR